MPSAIACSAAAKNASRVLSETRSSPRVAASRYRASRRDGSRRSSGCTRRNVGFAVQAPVRTRFWFPSLRKERFQFFSGGGDWRAQSPVRGGVWRTHRQFIRRRNLGPNRLRRCCGVGWGSSQPSRTSSAFAAFTVRRSKPKTEATHDALHVPPATHLPSRKYSPLSRCASATATTAGREHRAKYTSNRRGTGTRRR